MRKMPDAADLAAHQRFVRALAGSLVADSHAADDLVQDAWVAALTRGLREQGSLRAWFATVLRRRAAESAREREARARREAVAARGEALPSTLDMVERAGVQRDLVQAVLDLDEPYRTAILWRFLEELPPRAIARRAGVPVATVHSRIARGLAKLRERLDRDRGGDGRAWAIALAPLVRTPTGGPFLTGALAMQTATKVATLAAVIAATVVLWRTIDAEKNEAAPREVAHAASEERAEPAGAAPAIVDAPELARPRESAAAAQAAEVAPAETRTARLVRGEVLDSTGRPLGDVALRFDPERGAEPLRSDASGRFEAALPEGAQQVLSDDPRWATVLAGSAKVAADVPAVVVVAPRLDVAGTVVDEDGAPLLGAEIVVRIPRAFGADFGRPLDGATDRVWGAASDASGRFELADVPSVEGAALHAALGGFETRVEPLPPVSDRALTIVLRRPRESTGRLAGIVVDPAGGLVRGARVSGGDETAITDEGGRFELDVSKEPRPTKVTAARRGFLPAVLEPDRRADGSAQWPEHAVLRLGEEPRGVEGRVVDGAGAPVEGARVWIADPTFFGTVASAPMQVETLLGEGEPAFWSYATTDRDGAFRIGGLLERTYRLRAMDPRTLLAATSEPVEPGTKGLEIRLPKDALHARVKGRVVARDGSPVADVSVVLQRFGFQVELRGGGTWDEWLPRPDVRTDSDGRFELSDVPKEDVEIFVHGEPILFHSVQVKADLPVEDLTIVVSRRMHLQVELDEPIDRADQLQVLDGDGKPMILRIMRGETSFTNRRAEIADGRSQVISLSEDARTVVLTKAGVEVARIPVALELGSVTVVRH